MAASTAPDRRLDEPWVMDVLTWPHELLATDTRPVTAGVPLPDAGTSIVVAALRQACARTTSPATGATGWRAP